MCDVIAFIWFLSRLGDRRARPAAWWSQKVIGNCLTGLFFFQIIGLVPAMPCNGPHFQVSFQFTICGLSTLIHFQWSIDDMPSPVRPLLSSQPTEGAKFLWISSLKSHAYITKHGRKFPQFWSEIERAKTPGKKTTPQGGLVTIISAI